MWGRQTRVDVIDEATGTITDSIGIGGGPGFDVAVDAATDTVDVIDGATSTVTASISLPGEVVAITPDLSIGTLYAADHIGDDQYCIG
jgi:DNA-binding beta-propeller fold protein YncE